MKFYPIDKSPRVFIEEIPKWEKKWKCYDTWNEFYRKTHKSCAAPCPIVYYPEINVDELMDNRLRKYCENKCNPLPKKWKNDKKKKKERWIRFKNYPTLPIVARNYYKEFNLDHDFPIVKSKDLYFDRWQKNRRKPVHLVRLPVYYRGARCNNISSGPPNRFTAKIPTMSYKEIKDILLAEKMQIEMERQEVLKAKKESKQKGIK